MNKPVRLMPSSSDPPPLRRKSRIRPRTFSALSFASNFATSAVVLLMSPLSLEPINGKLA